ELQAFCDARLAGHVLVLVEIAKQALLEKYSILLGGSAAGSLVLYLLRLTAAEPGEHGLRFERFLRPGPQPPPDFDLRVAHTCRKQLWNHLLKRYGDNRVARLGLVVHFGVKTAWQWACKAHGLADEQQETLLAALARSGLLKDLLAPGLTQADLG